MANHFTYFPMFIGEREIKEFAATQEGNWITVTFTNGETAEMSGTVFFHIQTEEPVKGVTTTQLYASYFATEFLKELAINQVELGMITHILTAFENLIEIKKDKAMAHPFGQKYFLKVRVDQMLAEADAAEQEQEAADAAAKAEKPTEVEAK